MRFAILVALVSCWTVMAQNRPRARDFGIQFEGTPGPLNAITDIAGLAVGHTTLIRGDGPLKVGEGPVRTGVTVILPRQNDPGDAVFRRLVFAQRQWRDDGHHLGGGIRFHGGRHGHHQHP